MNQDFNTKKYKNILTLGLIVLVFFTPFWMAHWLFYNKQAFTHTTNHGQLITPPIDVTQLPFKNLQGTTLPSNLFKGQWTLLAIAPSPTDNSFKKLYEIRQIRLMLGKNMHKVRRMLLFYRAKTPIILSSQLTAPYTGSLFAVIDEKKWVALFESGELHQNPVIFDGFFIVDPNGRLMMTYSSDMNPKNIMQDLRRLIEANP